MTKVKINISDSDKFKKKLLDKLPSDLEIHCIEGDFYDAWEIRTKGSWFDWWRPSVHFDPISEEFYFFTSRDIALAKRLNKIFPDIPFAAHGYRTLELIQLAGFLEEQK